MSRGRKRNQRKRRTIQSGKHLTRPQQGQESASSAAYTAGKTFNYNYRINGPTHPIKTYTQETNTH